MNHKVHLEFRYNNQSYQLKSLKILKIEMTREFWQNNEIGVKDKILQLNSLTANCDVHLKGIVCEDPAFQSIQHLVFEKLPIVGSLYNGDKYIIHATFYIRKYSVYCNFEDLSEFQLSLFAPSLDYRVAAR